MKENNNLDNVTNKGTEITDKIVDAGSKIADKAIDKIMDKGSDVAGSIAGKAAGAAASKALMPIILKIVLGAVIAGGVGLGIHIGIKAIKPLRIEDTNNVISEIKKIGEFTTACYYEEIVVKDERVDTVDSWFGKSTNHNEIVIMGKGRVRAGFDFKKISEGDLTAHGDTLDIVLPKAEIFDIIMNPSDFITEYEEGTWSHESTKPLKVRAKQQLEQDALDCGLIERATINGRKRLKSVFAVFGFNTVNITIKDK